MMEERLDRIADNTRPKQSFNLVVSNNTNPVITTFTSPLMLNPKYNYEIALLSLDTYYTFPNINEDNNAFRYKKGDSAWKDIKLPIGCYEIAGIREETFRQVGNETDIVFTSNRNTLKCMIHIEKGYVVDFGVKNSIASVLGFKEEQYSAGYHSGEYLVNILQVNSILVHVDIAKNSYIKGEISPVVYNFFPNVSPGVKIIQIPKNLVYLPITSNYIYSMKVWLTDQNNRILDLQGEQLTIRFHMREC